jgi:hypothetical protein
MALNDSTTDLGFPDDVGEDKDELDDAELLEDEADADDGSEYVACPA